MLTSRCDKFVNIQNFKNFKDESLLLNKPLKTTLRF